MMEGQMSIFDFPEYLPTKYFDSMTEEDIFQRIESTFSVKLTRNGDEATFKLDGVLFTCGPFSNYFEGVRDGRRFFHMDAKRGNGSSGSPSESIEEIIDFIKKKRTFNKDGWHDISEEPHEGQFCKFEYLWSMHQKEDSKGQCTGWWKNGKVEWLNMPFDIGRKRVIRWQESEEPKEPKPVDIRGLLDDGYCPECGISLDDLTEECPECGCLLNWEHWKNLNEVE